MSSSRGCGRDLAEWWMRSSQMIRASLWMRSNRGVRASLWTRSIRVVRGSLWIKSIRVVRTSGCQIPLGTVRPDWICMRVVPLDRPGKEHQQLYALDF
jgi:hypothetical protein